MARECISNISLQKTRNIFRVVRGIVRGKENFPVKKRPNKRRLELSIALARVEIEEAKKKEICAKRDKSSCVRERDRRLKREREREEQREPSDEESSRMRKEKAN